MAEYVVWARKPKGRVWHRMKLESDGKEYSSPCGGLRIHHTLLFKHFKVRQEPPQNEHACSVCTHSFRASTGLRALRWRFGGCCAYCGEIVPFGEETRDHIIPRSKGGTNHIDNIALSCRSCNHRKGDRMPTQEEIDRVRRNRYSRA